MNMPKKLSPIEKAKHWKPANDDSSGEDKKIFLNYMIKNCLGYKNAMAIPKIIEKWLIGLTYQTIKL